MRLLLLIELSCLSFLSCVDSIDAAPPPHVLLAGVLHTALLPLTGDYSSSLLSCVPPSSNRLCVAELGPSLGKAWSSLYIMLATDFGGIRDISFICACFGEICQRVVSTTDLAEFFWNSCTLPNPLIPALPSYGLRPSFALRTQAHDSPVPRM
ncbi:uncharacterized protein UDID_18846 [Ustilago sp. UG-2017a]|nr:uncharacterized protein UDID_18846 [Ustilago sp. UG-2017a]